MFYFSASFSQLLDTMQTWMSVTPAGLNVMTALRTAVMTHGCEHDVMNFACTEVSLTIDNRTQAFLSTGLTENATDMQRVVMAFLNRDIAYHRVCTEVENYVCSDAYLEQNPNTPNDT